MRFLRGFLFCLLSFVAFLFLGGYISKLLGAAEGQGLASGAIVFMYALVAGLIGIVAAVFVLRHASPGQVTKLNIGLSVIALVLLFFIYLRIREMKQEEKLQREEQEAKPLVPVPSAAHIPAAAQYQSSAEDGLGLGCFSPDFYNKRVLYFYPFPEKGKSLMDHQPYDSLVFAHTEMDQIEISYAPPYLMPLHLKMDYDLLHFRVKRMAKDHLEIVVNEKTGLTAVVDKFEGKLTFWPDFILSANAVTLKEEFRQPLRVKAMAHSATVTVEMPYSHIRPESVEGYWLEVTLLSDKLQEQGRAWIQWRDEHRLLVGYSLLG